MPQFNVIQLNGAAMAFTFAVALVTGVLFGIFPALQTSRPDLHEELKGGAGSSISPSRRRRFTSSALVAGGNRALADAAGFRRPSAEGFRAACAVWTSVFGPRACGRPRSSFPRPITVPTSSGSISRSPIGDARRIAGVETAALSDRMPLEGGSNFYASVRGRPFQRMSGPLVETHSVSPDYFRVMGVRLLQGRVFTPADTQAAMATDARMRPSGERRAAVRRRDQRRGVSHGDQRGDGAPLLAQ